MSSNDWILIAAGRAPAPAPAPGEELAAAERELAEAEASGDQERARAATAELDRLVEEARERRRAERPDFSSGVRRPVRPELTGAQRMNEMFLELTGRRPPARRI
jgi:hypothetical protein